MNARAGRNLESARLRFASSILARLGEELIPDPDQGLLELARNAYDAGASRCLIEIGVADSGDLAIKVSDDGDGMDRDALVNGFLVVGRSQKPRTIRGRSTVGEKGLGRLAALRLGSTALIRTRPRDSGSEFVVDLNWQAFDKADVIEDVEIEIRQNNTTELPGTDILISGVKQGLSEAQEAGLARSLLLLSDPFGTPGEFEAILKTNSYIDLAEVIREQYLSAADFKLSASIDGSGRATAELVGIEGRELAKASHEDLTEEERYAAPSAHFELYVFRLGSGPNPANLNLRLRQVGVAKVRRWLSAVGGVHFYHRGLRVRPYGDPGFDWLGLDLARARSPEDRPSTNTLVGRVVVDDQNDLLRPKTDRVGFVENEALRELQRFALDATEWMARWRAEDSRQRRKATASKNVSRLAGARDKLDDAVQSLPPKERQVIEKAVLRYETATRKADEDRLKDIQLYRTLSTIGAATAVLAHETDKPTEQLQSLLKTLKRRVKAALGGQLDSQIVEPFEQLDRVVAGLRAIARMPLRLLGADRRRTRNCSVGEVVGETLDTFEYFLDRAQVTVVREFAMGDLVRAAPAAIEVIAANMIVNAVAAFYIDSRATAIRTLRVSTSVQESSIELVISDSGPGLQGIRPADVWKLGVTRREGGSGLGLAIVRDTLDDLGGTSDVRSPGELGGATFIVHFPRAHAT
ncbi:MAG: histidine kinase [Marmoricola sp.]|nr:histidine kinase [Marmoricola sp.]